MKATKILVLVVASVAMVAAMMWMTRRPAITHEVAPVASQSRVEPQASSEPDSPAILSIAKEETTPAESTIVNSAPPQEAGLTGAKQSPPKPPKEPLYDPEARVAMSLVGVDPEAEAYWLDAIFDLNLPTKEREDLMEDLNEDGLSDTKHPGPQDLPVILNRLAIIEQILPHADDFMVTHLGEAYKDLVNLAQITQGGGVPVR